jgi:hypothetical protein
VMSMHTYFQRFVHHVIEYCKKANIAIVQKHDTESLEHSLYTYSSYVQLSGAFQGIALISLEPGVAKAIVKHYITFKFHEGDWALFATDITSELVNIFAGNSLDIRENDDIQLGTPCHTSSRQVISTVAVPHALTLHTEYGALMCMYIPLQSNLNPDSLFQA